MEFYKEKHPGNKHWNFTKKNILAINIGILQRKTRSQGWSSRSCIELFARLNFSTHKNQSISVWRTELFTLIYTSSADNKDQNAYLYISTYICICIYNWFPEIWRRKMTQLRVLLHPSWFFYLPFWSYHPMGTLCFDLSKSYQPEQTKSLCL